MNWFSSLIKWRLKGRLKTYVKTRTYEENALSSDCTIHINASKVLEGYPWGWHLIDSMMLLDHWSYGNWIVWKPKMPVFSLWQLYILKKNYNQTYCPNMPLRMVNMFQGWILAPGEHRLTDGCLSLIDCFTNCYSNYPSGICCAESKHLMS